MTDRQISEIHKITADMDEDQLNGFCDDLEALSVNGSGALQDQSPQIIRDPASLQEDCAGVSER